MDRHRAENREQDRRAGHGGIGLARRGLATKLASMRRRSSGRTVERLRPSLETVLSFAAALAILIAIGLPDAPQQAHAAPPTTISGTCYVECEHPDLIGIVPRSSFIVRFPQYGIQTVGYCVSGPQYGAPMPGHYPFVGVRGADGGYRVTVDCSNAAMYPGHTSPLGPQNVGDFTIHLYGNVDVQKHGHAAYEEAVPETSLAGAVYELVAPDGARLATLVTDTEGRAEARDVPAGPCTLREIEPSPGYALDDGPQTLVVRGGQTTHADSWEHPLLGAVGLVKASSVPGITKNNPCYSLAGARYGVFDSPSCENLVQTIITDEAGAGQTDATLWPSTYWLKELDPPPGYALDDRAFSVVLSAQACREETVPVAHVADEPQLAPVDIIAAKIDRETERAEAQGDATLAGAVFAVEHYAGSFATPEEAAASGLAPTFSCTAITDAQGAAHIDPATLPRTNAGAGLPLGTLVIRETQAPQGYLVPDPAAVACPVQADGTGPLTATFHAPHVAQQVIRGNVEIVKFGNAEGSTGSSAIKQPLAGVAFDIVHEASGRTEARIVTDERGFATTASLRQKGQAGALAYGTYLVREDPATTPAGYQAVPAFSATVTEDGHAYSFLVEDTTGTTVRVVKQDAQTKCQVAGHTTFRILDAEGRAVSFTMPYPTPHEIDEFTTDDTGTCTLPDTINGGGTYYVQEIKPPHGYVLNDEPVAFTLTGADGAGSAPDNPLIVTMRDLPQTSRITITKVDAETRRVVEQAGVSWEVRAAEDIVTADGTLRARAHQVVATAVTDEQGTATTKELHLGAYELVETQAPEGYVRATEALRVQASYGPPTASCTSVEVTAPNRAARGVVELKKTDQADGRLVAGAAYEVRAREDIVAPDETILLEAGQVAATLVTDDDGGAVSPLLHLGSYDVVETQAPKGYRVDPASHPVHLAYENQDTACTTVRLDVTDEPLAASAGTMAATGEPPTVTALAAAAATSIALALAAERRIGKRLRAKDVRGVRIPFGRKKGQPPSNSTENSAFCR